MTGCCKTLRETNVVPDNRQLLPIAAYTSAAESLKSVWPRALQAAITLVAITALLLLYGTVQRLSETPVVTASAVDRIIPFVPEGLYVYLLFFPLIVVVGASVRWANFIVMLRACFLACGIAYILYLVFPTTAGLRPDRAGIASSVLSGLFRGLHNVDRYTNACPSMHVAISWLCAKGFTACHRNRRFLAWFVCSAVIVSTLVTKQHTIVDIGSGILLAQFCWDLSCRFSHRRRTPSAELLQTELSESAVLAGTNQDKRP